MLILRIKKYSYRHSAQVFDDTNSQMFYSAQKIVNVLELIIPF